MTVETIDDVIAALDAVVSRAETEGDRVGYFAALYRKVTVAMRAAIRAGEFLDGARFERLDVTFAKRYLDALEAYRRGAHVSDSWRVAFDACAQREPAILQHMYAGLAAHLLLDLGVAAAEIAPGPRIHDLRGDFEHVNVIVGRLMREVDAIVGGLSPLVGALDRVAGPQYAAANKLGISVARDVAWWSAQRLAPLDEVARTPLVRRMDGSAAFVADHLVRPRVPLGLAARLIRAGEPNDPTAVIRALRGASPPRRRRVGPRRRVAVLGGGIGGLTAAHELAIRGYEVDVYEATADVGGKAKSQSLRGTGEGGRADLPGEHGFRFFPSFYRHVIDTMDRIPVPGGTVAGRVRRSTEMAMAEKKATYVFKRHPPADLGDFFDIGAAIRDFYRDTDVPDVDFARFAHKMLEFMISCDERRLAEHERVSFWDWVGGGSYHATFQKYLATSRFMVAMHPQKASARTIATKAIQILTDFFRHGTRTDGVLDGPTNERWLEPWRQELEGRGVRFHCAVEIEALELGPRRRLSRVRTRGGAVEADHYVLAVPLDVAEGLVTDPLVEADPALGGLRRLRGATSWMVGAQFYLDRPIGACQGHIAFPDSYWALSAIAQAQFWDGGVERYGDGRVRDILSVDVSDWDTPSPRIGKRARDCTKRELLDEIWAQVHDGLALDRAWVLHEHLDENVEFSAGLPRNRTPLLVHPPGSWFDRPGADLAIDNLFLASDYVKTNTDLASMEGANEAARRAVNAILETDASAADPCTIWSMEEETGPLVVLAKRLDRRAFLLESEAGPALRLGGALGDLRAGGPPSDMDGVSRETGAIVDALRAARGG